MSTHQITSCINISRRSVITRLVGLVNNGQIIEIAQTPNDPKKQYSLRGISNFKQKISFDEAFNLVMITINHYGNLITSYWDPSVSNILIKIEFANHNCINLIFGRDIVADYFYDSWNEDFRIKAPDKVREIVISDPIFRGILVLALADKKVQKSFEKKEIAQYKINPEDFVKKDYRKSKFKMQKSFYITTPIYYVNDKPHIGHAYTSLASDVIARFKRLDGYTVNFLTGTDEHGQKVEKAAEAKSMDIQQFVDDLSKNFKNLSTTLDLTNDDFIRTTEERHKKAVTHLWQTLFDKGYIYLGEYAGWYAVRDEAFYNEDELIEGRAPTGAEVEWLVEPSYFFKLSQWQEPLLKFYSDHPDFIKPEGRFNEVLSFVKAGLKDLSISRSCLKWGIPVPNDDKHVIYVWLDALTNYITAIGYPNNLDLNFWNNSLHVMGKDILKFHAIYWPAFLMAAGITPPKLEFAHGWWTNEGVKISKSLGNIIDPGELVETFGSDAVRYFLLREVPFGQDGNFSRSALINRLNSDLANSYGNLVQRVLSFVQKNCNGKVPTPSTLSMEDKALLQKADNLLEKLNICIDNLELHRYVENIWQVIFAGNKYVDEQKPWTLKNQEIIRMNTVIYVLLSLLRKLAILTQPILPIGSSEILRQLGVNKDQRCFNNIEVLPESGMILPAPQPVFHKFEQL